MLKRGKNYFVFNLTYLKNSTYLKNYLPVECYIITEWHNILCYILTGRKESQNRVINAGQAARMVSFKNIIG